MTQHLRAIDAVIIVLYLAAMAGMGLRFSRRQKTTERYFVAKRSVPGWAMGLSLLATLISSVTFIAYPGSAYAGDWSNLVPGLMVLPVLAVTVAVVIPFFRHAVGMSAYEYFGNRFGYGARVYSSLAYSLGHFSKMGFVFYLLALTVSSMTGWDTERLIVAVGLLTIGYTLLGGIEAVIWADVIQGFVLWFGIFICLGYLLFIPDVGPAGMLRAAWVSHKISLGSMSMDFRKPTIPVLALYGLFYYFQRYTADQTVIQRYLVAKSDRAAVRGILLGSLLCVPVWVLFMLIGTLCWTFYQVTGEKLPAYLTKGDQVFPYFITSHVPAGLAGLFVAALFGAAMANLSSDLNSLAAVGVEDYYRVLRKGSTDRQRLFAGKVIVGVCGVLCIGIATMLAHTNGSALSLWFTVSAIVLGGLAGLFLLAFLAPRVSGRAAYCGIGASAAFTVWASVSGGFKLHSYMIGVFGQFVLMGVGLGASLVLPNCDAANRELTLWGWLRKRGHDKKHLASAVGWLNG